MTTAIKPHVALFGELLMRLETPQQQRFVQTETFHIGYTGGEANAGVLLAQWGIPASLISAVPNNDLGIACVNQMRRFGLDVSQVHHRDGRLGLFFLETGAGHRATQVLYDRRESAFAHLKPGDIDWNDVLAGKSWLHFTGTAPALSPALAELTLEACQAAQMRGITVSCDINYRSALWSIAAARETMMRLVRHVDILIANEEHARQILGAPAAQGSEDLFDPRRYEPITRYLRDEFQLRSVALTIRAGSTFDETSIAAVIDDGEAVASSHKYVIRPLDRIGAGDAFTGAYIYGSVVGLPLEETVELAAAASCLKHAVRGDLGLVSLAEAQALAAHGPDGRVRR